MFITAGTSKHYLVREQQLKPILAYMKAQIVQTYVFIEKRDFYRNEIVNANLTFRLKRLGEDLISLTETIISTHKAKEGSIV